MDKFQQQAAGSIRSRHEDAIRASAGRIKEYADYVLRDLDRGRVSHYAGSMLNDAQVIVTRYQGRVTAFRRDDRRSNDRMRHQSFKTMAQADHDERYSAAITLLRDHGIEVSPRKTITAEQAEALAEVVRSW